MYLLYLKLILGFLLKNKSIKKFITQFLPKVIIISRVKHYIYLK